MEYWTRWTRPGYFGRQKDERIAQFDRQFGKGNWDLRWVVTADFGDEISYNFFEACRFLYERSYMSWFIQHPEAVEHITGFGQVYDNDPSNIQSGLDYCVQESYSTHIQDIAVRNCLWRLGTWFKGEPGKLLQIRSSGEGEKYNPGHIPFYDPDLIGFPSLKSLRPKWAEAGSVEDFWQSNKWVMVKEK